MTHSDVLIVTGGSRGIVVDVIARDGGRAVAIRADVSDEADIVRLFDETERQLEVARAILWLLSDESSYSTGTFIDVSGGR